MRSFARILPLLVVVALAGCNNKKKPADSKEPQKHDNPGNTMGLSVQSEPWGKVGDREVKLYHLTNSKGMKVSITDYGATVTVVRVADKAGDFANVTLGFDNLKDYQNDKINPYFGTTVGRYANRIKGGKFTLNDKEYTLATNNGPNHLHGGEKGFDNVIWDSAEVQEERRVGVKFTYASKPGEEGYPGGLTVHATYWVTEDNELAIEYEITAQEDTVHNITNHCYWNLRTPEKGDIKNHILQINCEELLATDQTLIPTGEFTKVKDTAFDFTKPKAIGKDIAGIKLDGKVVGYDNCYVISRSFAPGTMKLVAVVKDPESGRVMEISTDQPGIQFYSGNFLDKANKGQHGQHHAFCLETQHFPDSPNQKAFPTTVLKKGEVFKSKTVHAFKVEK